MNAKTVLKSLNGLSWILTAVKVGFFPPQRGISNFFPSGGHRHGLIKNQTIANISELDTFRNDFNRAIEDRRKERDRVDNLKRQAGNGVRSSR